MLASTRARSSGRTPKTGLTGAESSTFLLPRLIGLRRAMELVLLNPRLTAAQAREYGLVTAVYADDEFDDAGRSIVAAALADGPPPRVRARPRNC